MTVRTGSTEPNWPTKSGAKVIEYSGLDGEIVAPVEDTPPRLPPDIEERYGNRYWDLTDFRGIG